MTEVASKIHAPKIILVAVITIIFDQLSKWIILSSLVPYQLVPVIEGLFNLTLTYNKGIAFGLLAGVPDHLRVWLLLFTTGLAFLLVLFFLLKEYRNHLGSQLALAIILGGALGNIIDRVRIGMVVDFLDFHVGAYHWPAFNIADSAICVGVMYLIFLAPSPKRAPGETAENGSAAS